MADNRCAQCGQPQRVDGLDHPMIHLASRGLHSTAEDMVSLHLDCLPHDLEQAHRDAGYGALIDKVKGDTSANYEQRRAWAEEHAARQDGE